MDFMACPKCRTESLIEVKTSKTPVKPESEEINTEVSQLRQPRCSMSEMGPRQNTVSTSTENENWENVLNNSFTPLKNMAPDQKRISDQPMIHSNSFDMKHNDVIIQDIKNVRSQLSFDCLKSPESKVVASNLTNNSICSNTMVGSNLMNSALGDVHFGIDSNTVYLHGQTKTPAMSEMPKLEKISGPHNNMMPLTGQVFSPNYRTVSSSGQVVAQGVNKVPLSRQVNNGISMLSQSETPANDIMSKSHQQPAQMPQFSVNRHKNNFVDTEVQTDFVLQQPKFYYPAAQSRVQPIKETNIARGYNYEPRKPIGGEKENNILRAAIRRSNTEGWNNGLERMNDLCIGERRF